MPFILNLPIPTLVSLIWGLFALLSNIKEHKFRFSLFHNFRPFSSVHVHWTTVGNDETGCGKSIVYIALNEGLQFNKLQVEQAKLKDLKEKPEVSDLVFGKIFTDHMLTIDWDDKIGWHAPKIAPFQNLSLHPGAKVLHYAQELFEGMKAYRYKVYLRNH